MISDMKLAIRKNLEVFSYERISEVKNQGNIQNNLNRLNPDNGVFQNFTKSKKSVKG